MDLRVFCFALTIVTVLGGDYDAPQTLDNRQTMVHLFEWHYKQIAEECENFLQYYNYGAVQISPPTEHIQGDPWWIRYQPVSYRLHSRSGTEDELRDTIKRCNAVGVKIVADVVINHMAGAGQRGQGTDGCGYDSGGAESFPCVPYGPNDFNDGKCHTGDGNIHNYQDATEVRVCRLSGLLDLDGGSTYVRGKISEMLNKLVDMGVVGFRMDAAKHMWPGDIGAIMGMVKNLPNGQRPFLVQEVIDQGGEPVTCDQYTGNGRVTNFKYGLYLASAANRAGQNFKYFDTFGQGWGMWADNDVLNFVDNHDNQRGSGGGGSILNYKNGDKYIMAVAYMLAYPYGYPRVMSSYYFSYSDQGPPGGIPSFNADSTCNAQSGWVCEHRWPAIRNMVNFRSHVGSGAVLDVVKDDNRLAFRRGNGGFFALNNGFNDWSNRFQTGLSSGTYCDLISGEVSNGKCTGGQVSVDGSGFAQISIGTGKAFAIATFSNVNGGGGGPTQAPPTVGPTLGPISGQRTVVFIKKTTQPGEDLFVRGGLDQTRHTGCTNDASTSQCAIPIRHRTVVPSTFLTYTDWSANDYYLDWYGAEGGQAGTPLAWSTNVPAVVGYQSLNTYGSDYWIVDVTMDCTRTEDGWFELKAFLQGATGVWEGDISQSTCGGSAGGTVPFVTKNHAGRCGFVNVFEFGANGCTIDKL